MKGVAAQTNSQDLELILHEIESLPTLSSVAVRVLDLSGRDDAELQEIAALIESDPTLSARILSMCRRADRTTANDVISVERAVVLLGLDAVRAAMLSVELFGVISGEQDLEGAGTFDREGFWCHSLAVACASEEIAKAHREEIGIKPSAAFVAGLVHDLGKLALHWVLPKAYERVLRGAAGSRTDLASIERRALGVDHFVAGKRLAEHWQLPHALQDVMWLHGQPEVAVPDLAHRKLVGIVCTGDALARSLHVGWSGDGFEDVDLRGLCDSWSFDIDRVRRAGEGVHRAVAERAKSLGLGDEPGEKLLLESIGEANKRLGVMAGSLERRSRDKAQLMRGVDAITKFSSESAGVSSLGAACGAVLRSAASIGCGVDERGVFALFWRSREGAAWRLFVSNTEQGAVERSLDSQPEGGGQEFGTSRSGELTLGGTSLLRWAREQMKLHCGVCDEVSFVPLLKRGGAAALLAHDRGAIGARVGDEVLASIASVWGLALAGAGQHSGARGVSERLAQANMKLAETQSALIEGRSMAMLGRMTAGAAHEMNNPLAVISGNAQKLRCLVRGDEAMDTTNTIIDASEKLSDLISALHTLASPPEPEFEVVEPEGLIESAVTLALTRLGEQVHDKVSDRIIIEVEDALPEVWVDAGQIRQVIAELVLNGLESSPDAEVRVLARLSDRDGRLEVRIADNGPGMSRETLGHACDPFFSHRDAGRGVGLGLARSRRFAEMNGCGWMLSSEIGVGTSVEIRVPLLSGRDAATDRAA